MKRLIVVLTVLVMPFLIVAWVLLKLWEYVDGADEPADE